MNIQRSVAFSIATAFTAAIPLSAQIGVTGAPYCITQTTERIQTLVDGTHITQPGQKRVMCRDSAGRTREEVTFQNSIGNRPAPVMVIIFDPVAGFQYQLNANNKTAQKFALHGLPPQPRSTVIASTGTISGVVAS